MIGGVGAFVVGNRVGDDVVGVLVGAYVVGDFDVGASVGDNVLGARVKVGDFVRVGDELVGVLVVGVEVVGESDVGAFEVGECVIGDCVGADVSEQLAPKYPMLHIHTHCPFE